eukprot:10669273-Alexandrium_andersonii.AAC.1
MGCERVAATPRTLASLRASRRLGHSRVAPVPPRAIAACGRSSLRPLATAACRRSRFAARLGDRRVRSFLA